MSSNTIEKAEIILDVLLTNSEKNDVSAKELVDEILAKWRDLN